MSLCLRQFDSIGSRFVTSVPRTTKEERTLQDEDWNPKMTGKVLFHSFGGNLVPPIPFASFQGCSWKAWLRCALFLRRVLWDHLHRGQHISGYYIGLIRYHLNLCTVGKWIFGIFHYPKWKSNLVLGILNSLRFAFGLWNMKDIWKLQYFTDSTWILWVLWSAMPNPIPFRGDEIRWTCGEQQLRRVSTTPHPIWPVTAIEHFTVSTVCITGFFVH